MKKAAVMLTCVCVAFLLCGCSLRGKELSHTNEYLVSAISFDKTPQDQILVGCELIIINTEKASENAERKVVFQEGKTISEAFSKIYKFCTQPLQMSHCSTAVLGEGLTAENIREILNYFHTQEDITLSISVIRSETAGELLQCEPISSIAMGYDIISLLETKTHITGLKFKNKFYQIEAQREKPLNVIELPVFERKENTALFTGLEIFIDETSKARLDFEQSILYAIITDSYSKGRVNFDSKEYKIESNLTTVFFENKENLIIKLKLNIKSDNPKIKKNCQEKIKEMLLISQQNKVDIFGFANILYHKERKIWNSVKQDYVNRYKNATIRVEAV